MAAPFFRFPALQQPPEALTYLGTRNVGIFSADFDSFDFKMRRPEQVRQSVMTKLQKHGKGIILMHDFRHATAEALPEIIRQLKDRGYKVVHMVPRAPVTTSRPGVCCTVAASGGLCEGEQLQEVVGGADHGPLGTYFLDAAQQELAEAACLFDLSEHWFHHLLSQSVGCFEVAVVDLLSHPLGQRSTNFSVCRCRVLGASRCDIAVDTTCYECFEIGFAAVARVR